MDWAESIMRVIKTHNPELSYLLNNKGEISEKEVREVLKKLNNRAIKEGRIFSPIIQVADNIQNQLIEKTKKNDKELLLLDKKPKSLVWKSEVERLTTNILKAMKVPKNEISTFAIPYMMRGVIARIMKPGTHFPHMVILRGRQRGGKSRFCRLFHDVVSTPIYTFTHMDGSKMINRQSFYAAISGKSIIEYSEMDNFNKISVDIIKSIITENDVETRKLYTENRNVSTKLSNIFIGTSNDIKLKDITGNDRFIILDTNSSNKGNTMDFKALKDNLTKLKWMVVREYNDFVKKQKNEDDINKYYEFNVDIEAALEKANATEIENPLLDVMSQLLYGEEGFVQIKDMFPYVKQHMEDGYNISIRKVDMTNCLKTLGFVMETTPKHVKGYKSPRNNLYTNTKKPLSLKDNLATKAYFKYGFVIPPNNASNIRDVSGTFYKLTPSSYSGYFEGIKEYIKQRTDLKWDDVHKLWIGLNTRDNRYEVSPYYNEKQNGWYPATTDMLQRIKDDIQFTFELPKDEKKKDGAEDDDDPDIKELKKGLDIDNIP